MWHSVEVFFFVLSDVVTFELLEEVYFNPSADECLMTRCYDIIFIKKKFSLNFFFVRHVTMCLLHCSISRWSDE